MEPISFTHATIPAECLPSEELADCAATALGRDGKTLLSYGSGAGYTPLRELIASWFDVHPYRVVITNGSQQALRLLADCLVPGQPVLVESPTSNRSRAQFLEAGAWINTIVVDEDGLNLDDLGLTLQTRIRPAFLYMTPTFQNPTGTVLPASRRRPLVQVAEARGLRIVEDDPWSLLRLDGEAVPALFDFSEKRTIYLSSFSATIAPGLRVGWLILPDDLAPTVIEAANNRYITPSLLGQATAFEFINRGAFGPQVERVREALRVRRDATLAALDRHFPTLARWNRPTGGPFIWLQALESIDLRPVMARAEGVTALDGTVFGAPSDRIRLAYSGVDPERIEEGVAALAAAFTQTD